MYSAKTAKPFNSAAKEKKLVRKRKALTKRAN